MKPGDYTLASSARIVIEDAIDLHGQLDAARPTINLDSMGPPGLEANDSEADTHIRYLRVINISGPAIRMNWRGLIERVVGIARGGGGGPTSIDRGLVAFLPLASFTRTVKLETP